MRRRLIQMLILAATATTAWAQSNCSKLSVTTQMFLDEQAGNISFEQTEEQIKARAKAKGVTFEEASRQAKYDRPIARPVDIDGRKFIPAFVRVTDRSAVSELEALGVEVQCEFLNGTLFTTMIPVDKLQDVADIAKVSRVSVSAKRRPLTDKARQATNVDDALTLSNDAVTAGLNQKYDGTGVLLGIIDNGIDFQHIAFKDKNGNSRIKHAYVVTATYNPRTYKTTYSEKEYGDGTSNAITSSAPTTDDSSEDHGTQTSSTAGGSSVIVSGSTVTVTDDHANATYGGMAPGADLFLAGCDLSDTYLANSFQKICNYADSKGMPVVVSNSWGSSVGPRDGTGEMADIIGQYFGDSHPNHICLFASSNDAGKGGYHVSGNASSSNPLGTVCQYASGIDGLDGLYGIIAEAWSRSTSASLSCNVLVLDTIGNVKQTVNVNLTSGDEYGKSVSLSSTYCSGQLTAYKDILSDNKSQIILFAGNSDYGTQLVMKSGYQLAVQFYPSSGSSIIDVWASGGYNYFTTAPSTNGYTWTAGSDDNCVSDEATIPDAISIGAYVTKNRVTDYNGTTHSLASSYPNVGDIAYLSSYATADQSPTGLAYPWICAPGATIVAGVNHYDTSGSLSYINDNSTYYDMYRVNKNTTNPYGSMEGTSMATPTAAGIVALWLQASMDKNALHKNLTVNDVKQIMKETAINDAYTTTGANASHFGNGKIDALAGIKYILGTTDDPTIVPGQKTMTFSARLDNEAIQTLHVSGRFLTQNVTATLTDANGVFAVDKTSIEVTDEGADIAVSFRSAVEGTFEGTLVLASAGAASVTITLTATAMDDGSASDTYLNITKYQTIDEAGWSTNYVNTLYKYTEYEEDEVAWLTMPVYGAWVGTYYNSHPQKWIESNITSTNNTYAGVTWNANDVLQGSSSYFTATTGNGRARAMGTDSRNSTTQRTVSFYVTNVTEAKLLGMGRTGVTSDYPAALKVYECTKNSDGSITASSTVTKSATSTSTSTSTAYTLTVSNLDAAKVYKVEASTYRGFMYEIGFQTLLPKKYQLGDVNHDGNVDIADAMAIVNHILGLAQTGIFDEELADVDGIGGISITDVTNIINIVLK